MNKREAEVEINAILQRLEKDTGQIVTGISINEIDVTRLGDQESLMQTGVEIHLHRLPGRNWGSR